MPVSSPYKKFFKIAFITSPLFGLFGATPGLTSHEFELLRELSFMLFITSFTLYLWLVNILLLRIFNDANPARSATLRYLLSAVTCIATIYFIFQLLPHQPPRHFAEMQAPGMRPVIKRHSMVILPIVQGLSIDVIIIVLMELMLLREIKMKVDMENELLKMANLEARNSQLMQQLNPHFLFNSLSTLRSLIGRSTAQAEEYLERLAELLRFSTNSGRQSLVSLKEELMLCSNYLEMQQTRFGDALYYEISIPAAIQMEGKVPVFALQQLAENAIKHNVLTNELPLRIRISVDETTQWLSITNNLQPKPTIEPGSGVGLANLSERYRLAGHDDIVISKTADSFCVFVKIIYDAGTHH